MFEITTLDSTTALDLIKATGNELSIKEYEELTNTRKLYLSRLGMVDFENDTLVIICMRALANDYVTKFNKMEVIKKILWLFYSAQAKVIQEDDYVLDALFYHVTKYKGYILKEHETTIMKFILNHQEVPYE